MCSKASVDWQALSKGFDLDGLGTHDISTVVLPAHVTSKDEVLLIELLRANKTKTLVVPVGAAQTIDLTNLFLFLRRNSSLEKLDLSLSDKGNWPALFSLLNSRRNITKLDISKSQVIEETTIVDFANFISGNSSLKSLRIEGANLIGSTAVTFWNSLGKNSSLIKLKIEHHSLVPSFVDYLVGKPALQKLNVEFHSESEHILNQLSDALSELPYLTSLHITFPRSNRIPVMVPEINYLYKKIGTKLKKLGIENLSGMTSSVADFILGNPNLEKLKLGMGNNFVIKVLAENPLPAGLHTLEVYEIVRYLNVVGGLGFFPNLFLHRNKSSQVILR